MAGEGPGLAVVTGASSGIGAAYARRLAAGGYDLLLVARREDRLGELAAEIEGRHGGRVSPVAADISTNVGVDRVLASLEGREVAFLVNGAGFGTRSRFAETEEAKLLGMVGLHVVATVRLVRGVLPGMVSRGAGSIVNVSSLAAFFTGARYVTYSATKAFINTFTLGLRDELDGTGVTVQVLCPGLTDTEFVTTAEYAEFDYSRVPRRFWMTPEAVVAGSIDALGRGPVVVVPGRANRAFVSAMRGPAGPILMGALGLAARRHTRRTGGDESKAYV